MCDNNVKVMCQKRIDYNDAMRLRDLWEKENNIKSTANTREFMRIVKNEHNLPFRYITVYYEKTLIALRVMLLSWNGCIYSLFNIHTRNTDENTPYGFIVRHNMSEKMQVLCYNFFLGEYERIFILGCRPSEKRLLAHKENISDGKIKYFIV